jgi:hypothetical protein
MAANDAPDVRVKVKDTGRLITITRELYDTSQDWETGSPYTLLKADPYGPDGLPAPVEFPAQTSATAATTTKES